MPQDLSAQTTLSIFWQKHSDVKVVILDALTYAGNLGTIAKDIDNERCFFIKGDICSREVVDGLFAEYRFDYVVNFAAESHGTVALKTRSCS